MKLKFWKEGLQPGLERLGAGGEGLLAKEFLCPEAGGASDEGC